MNFNSGPIVEEGEHRSAWTIGLSRMLDGEGRWGIGNERRRPVRLRFSPYQGANLPVLIWSATTESSSATNLVSFLRSLSPTKASFVWLNLLVISECGQHRDIRIANCATYIHCHWTDGDPHGASSRGRAEQRHTLKRIACQSQKPSRAPSIHYSCPL